MTATNASSDLGFEREVRTAFAFLEKEFGFEIKTAMATLVRYESNRAFVNVYHGRTSYQVAFEVGRLGHDEKFYPVDVTALSDAPRESFFQASSRDRVSICVRKLADLLRSAGERVLTGDPFAYKRLHDVQRRQSDELMAGSELRTARADADEAWAKRDYKRVLEVLEPFIEHLRPSELKKLDYARSHRSIS